MAEKIEIFIFLPENSFLIYFDLKHLGNTIETLLNQSMTMKNIRNHPKTRNKKKNHQAQIWFLGVFKAQTTHNSNSPCHMKPFDIKITVLIAEFLPINTFSL